MIVFVLALYGFSIQDAHAASVTFTTNTTIITSQNIGPGETWTVNSGVTLTINPGVTINNSNGGSINNSGTIIINLGTIVGSGDIINNSGGSINNSGTINSSGNINNFGIITNSGTIINSFFITNNGIINNSGTINNSSIVNNLGAINQCGGGVYLGGLTGNPINNITCCVPPGSGEWMIASSCTIISNVIAPDNVHVQNNAVVTIENGGTLNVNFASKFLMIHSGSKVLIKFGGKIF